MMPVMIPMARMKSKSAQISRETGDDPHTRGITDCASRVPTVAGTASALGFFHGFFLCNLSNMLCLHCPQTTVGMRVRHERIGLFCGNTPSYIAPRVCQASVLTFRLQRQTSSSAIHIMTARFLRVTFSQLRKTRKKSRQP